MKAPVRREASGLAFFLGLGLLLGAWALAPAWVRCAGLGVVAWAAGGVFANDRDEAGRP